VTRDGYAKILDFGIAKLLEGQVGEVKKETSQDLSRTKTLMQTTAGTIMGTAAYMSPEQARGQPVSQASDVFSLGIVIYEMISGELPFKGDSPLDTMHSIAFDEARPVTAIRKNLPVELNGIITRCLRKNPRSRYPNAIVLADDLKHLKREIETGTQTTFSRGQRLQAIIEWIKTSMPFGFKGIALAAVALILIAAIIFTKFQWSILIGLTFLGFVIYRYVRNRKSRMLNRFVAKVSKFPEVKAISFDDLTKDEFQQMMREPGVLYVSEDSILEAPNKPA
jgi:serine/threonine protein kinase